MNEFGQSEEITINDNFICKRFNLINATRYFQKINRIIRNLDDQSQYVSVRRNFGVCQENSKVLQKTLLRICDE